MDIELFEDKIISVEDWEEMKKEEAEKNKTDKNKTDRKKTNKKKWIKVLLKNGKTTLLVPE